MLHTYLCNVYTVCAVLFDLTGHQDLKVGDTLYSIPVLVEGYRSDSGGLVNAGSDRTVWQLVRLFYLAESTSTDGTAINYASFMQLVLVCMYVRMYGDGRLGAVITHEMFGIFTLGTVHIVNVCTYVYTLHLHLHLQYEHMYCMCVLYVCNLYVHICMYIYVRMYFIDSTVERIYVLYVCTVYSYI